MFMSIREAPRRFRSKCDGVCSLLGLRKISQNTYSVTRLFLMLFGTSFCDLVRDEKNDRRNGYIFNQKKKKLRIRIYSNLSNINISYYLKLQIPIMHRQLFKILSQNTDYVKTHCSDLSNSFHFACRRWYSQC